MGVHGVNVVSESKVSESRKKAVSAKVDCALCGTVGQSPFQDLQRPDLERLSERKIHNVYRRSQSLYYEGNRPTGVFCIKEGRVKCYRLGPGGQRQIVRIAEPGDVLGFSAVVRSQNHAESAEALEDAVICFIPKESFTAMLGERRELLNRLFLSMLSENEELESQIVSMATMSVRERTIRLLAHLARHYPLGEKSADGTIWIDVPLTRQEMAEMIGTSVETFIRMLADLKDAGVLTSRGRTIGVPDLVRLEELASEAA